MLKPWYRYFYTSIFCLAIMAFLWVPQAHAQVNSQTEVNQLEQNIQTKLQERNDLEREAERLREELANVGTQKNSLSQEISLIASERRALENQINQTLNDIETISLEVRKSQSLIDEFNTKIRYQSNTLESLLRRISHIDKLSYFELIFSSRKLPDVLLARDAYARLQEPLIDLTYDLKESKEQVFENTKELATKQQDLSLEQSILDDQRNIVRSQEEKKDAVLQETKNKESTYQQNLKNTLETIKKLDQEIRTYESTLEFLLDPSQLPEKDSEAFAWPLDHVLITQRFGRTVSSERLYTSGSHSGVDFRAATGTPVYAVADGVVKGIGDTDKTCPRASFGKWAFIEHTNLGLSTTYGHLSGIRVEEGQQVQKGDVIAYSGNTGRSTGPHLHLTVYATEGVDGDEGVRVTSRPSAACVGQTYRMPLAPTAAYLDPLDFLPPTTINMYKHPSVAL